MRAPAGADGGAGPLAVLRADASPTIGGGHLARCLALADALSLAGWRTMLAARAGTVETVPVAASLPLIALPDGRGQGDVAALARALPGGCDLLVIDTYDWDEGEERACRGFARRIAVIDDFARSGHAADLVLDPTPGRRASAYRHLTGEGAVVLAGAAWAPLRRRIREAREASLHARRGRGLGRIIVSMGMTDPGDASSAALAGAAGAAPAIDVVLGRAAPHRAALAGRLPASATLHIDPPNLAGLLAAADLAIGAGGVSALERACLGLPSLLVEIADNQRDAIAGLAAAGAARALGPLGGTTAGDVAAAIASLAGEGAALEAMSAAAAAACDGLGAARAATWLAPEHAHDGLAVSLRPAEMGDAPLLLAWQGAPGMRRHFRSTAVPSPEEHEAWLARTLSDPGRVLSLALCGGEPVAMLRLDRCAEATEERHEVSILVAPSHQRRGIGAATLRLAARLVPSATMTAEIASANQPSEALFAACGYSREGGTAWRRPPMETRHR